MRDMLYLEAKLKRNFIIFKKSLFCTRHFLTQVSCVSAFVCQFIESGRYFSEKQYRLKGIKLIGTETHYDVIFGNAKTAFRFQCILINDFTKFRFDTSMRIYMKHQFFIFGKNHSRNVALTFCSCFIGSKNQAYLTALLLALAVGNFLCVSYDF